MTIIRSESILFNEDGSLDLEVLQSCIKEHQTGLERLQKLADYYDGKHAIENRQRMGANNRLTVNHAEYITDFSTGYFIGNPITYSFPEGQEDVISTAYKMANIDMVDQELCRDISKFGTAIELIYQDEDGITKSTNLDPRQAFLIVSDTVDYKTLAGVHFYDRKDKANKVIGKTVNVYLDESKTVYLEEKNNLTLEGEEDNLFGRVPMIEYWNKSNQYGDFESVIPLIDAYNQLQSDRINDKQQFVDALLVLYGTITGDDDDEKIETLKKLKQMGVLEMPSDTRAEFIVKTFSESDVELLKQSIVNDIHKISKVPNLTDENFAGNSSGVAMRYKLLGLEQLAQTKEGYYRMGLRERLQLYAAIASIKALQVDISEIEIGFTRSLPVNENEIASMVAGLKGTVSQETLLAQLPFVADIQAEIERVQEEKKQKVKDMQQTFGGYEVQDEGLRDGQEDTEE